MKSQRSEAICRNDEFQNPHTLSNKFGRVLWTIAFNLLYRWTPPRLGMPWRRMILWLFGAKIGKSWLHPSTRLWAPWQLEVGDSVYIDHGCYLYNPYPIRIHDRVIVSFGCVLCTPSHDYTQPQYPLVGDQIVIESDCWLMAEAFVCPGVHVHEGSVVAARAVVTRDVAPLTVVGGNPAKFIKNRVMAIAPRGQ
jgi:putative colanic acid biosynthesis acetyltransferase WcaF